ncbi:kelch-like protein 24 [Asterias rubens]|uniref:kelch-like protein 24 n=1 Tax=Asterias rubens TaxID=7604 RepID=UPI0014554B81|nr:kelch-like protein 24 [Asterias rubens]XP_033644736.1 kelch-like protein 24 [Asterias rubens]
MASSAWPAISDDDVAQERRDFCDYENYALPGVVLSSFNEMRQTEDLIDVVLVTEDKQISCHRVVLAASSPYFKAMFTGNLEEKSQQRVTLKDVNSEMLQLIVDYVYTSQVRITTANVQELLATANFFLIKCLVYACSNFLIRQLDVDNCVEMHCFAESQGCVELAEAACRFVVHKFPEVSKTEAFLRASSHLLYQYAANENLNLRSETELLHALLEWLTTGEDRDAKQECFLSLVKHVRLPFIGHECLEQVSKSVEHLTGCKELFGLALDCKEDKVTSPPMEWRCPRRSTNYVEVLVVVGGVRNRHPGSPELSKSNTQTYCCDPHLQLRHWSTLAPLPYTLRNKVMYDIVRFKNDIFLTGGFDGERHLGATACVWRYLTEMDTWEPQKGLNIARYQHCSAVLCGQIYVIGGYDGITKLASVETYSPETKTWTCIQPMIAPVAFPAVTAFNERLYVIGGITSDDNVFNGIQCYDSQSQTWSVIDTLQVVRKGCKSVLLNNMIYIFGGAFQEVQVYDPACDKAFNVSPMIGAHMCTGATVLNGKIYVAGGDNLQTDSSKCKWDSIECYDPSTDKWSVVGTMPLSLYLHGVVTVVRNCLTMHVPSDIHGLKSIGPSMLYRGYGEGEVNYDPR